MIKKTKYKDLDLFLINVDSYDAEAFDEIFSYIENNIKISVKEGTMKLFKNKQLHWVEYEKKDFYKRNGQYGKNAILELKVRRRSYDKLFKFKNDQ